MNRRTFLALLASLAFAPHKSKNMDQLILGALPDLDNQPLQGALDDVHVLEDAGIPISKISLFWSMDQKDYSWLEKIVGDGKLFEISLDLKVLDFENLHNMARAASDIGLTYFVRPGYEYNGWWAPRGLDALGSARKHEKEFLPVFNRIADIFRQYSDDVMMVLCASAEGRRVRYDADYDLLGVDGYDRYVGDGSLTDLLKMSPWMKFGGWDADVISETSTAREDPIEAAGWIIGTLEYAMHSGIREVSFFNYDKSHYNSPAEENWRLDRDGRLRLIGDYCRDHPLIKGFSSPEEASGWAKHFYTK